MDLNIQLDQTSGKHLYEQIYEYIRDEIRGGKLLVGEKLPSTRSLAGYLHVSRSTTELAYEQLAMEGYIHTRKNSGAYVSGIEHDLDLSMERQQDAEHKEQKSRAHDTGAPCREARPLIDFSPRTIDMTAFPYATWRRILRGLMENGNAEIFLKGDPQGDAPLRLTIARYLHLSRGVNCEPEQIIIGAGNDYLLLLLRYILGEHRNAAMENPTYIRAARIFTSLGWEVTPVLMDADGMNIGRLRETSCDTVYVMPARQYPTGVLMPYTRRMELLSWAGAGEDRYIIEDDYDSEFMYRGKPVTSLESLDRGQKVIYMGSFSKTIAPGIRFSFMVLPWPLLERFRAGCSFLSSTVSRIDQSILNEFIRDGYFERYLNRMRNRYGRKHDLMLEGLGPFKGRFQVKGAGAGLHLILEEDRTCSLQEQIQEEKRLEEEAGEAGVRVYPLSDLYLPGKEIPRGQPCRPAVMLGFAALDEDAIRQGLEKLAGAWLQGKQGSDRK